MAYIIIRANGTTLTTIQDGTINTTSCSVGLPGRNYPGYGQVQGTAFVRIIENFADDTPPNNALKGQLWYNTNTSTLNVCPYDKAPQNAWMTLSTVTSSGDVTLGNITVVGTHTASGNIVSSSSGNKLQFSIIESNGTANLTTVAISNTCTVTGQANVGSLKTTAITTGSSSTDGTITGQWAFNGVTGANTITVTGQVVADAFYYSDGTPVPSSSSAYGNTQVAAYLPTYTGNIGGNNSTRVNTLTTNQILTNYLGNTGAGGTIRGVWTLATGAKIDSTYADIAECYESDYEYQPGTLVKLGGQFEVTKLETECDEVFGVVSDKPGFVMNAVSKASSEQSVMIPIVIAGRTPIKVSGNVTKFARLVSGENGCARMAIPQIDDKKPSIGRALESGSNTTLLASVMIRV
jgi:hypothetical protein